MDLPTCIDATRARGNQEVCLCKDFDNSNCAAVPRGDWQCQVPGKSTYCPSVAGAVLGADVARSALPHQCCVQSREPVAI